MKKSAFVLAAMLLRIFLLSAQEAEVEQTPAELPQTADTSGGQPDESIANSKIAEGAAYFDDNNELRQFVSDEYGTLTLNSFNSEKTLIDSYENTSVRRMYDDKMRLISKEWWTIAAAAKDSSLLKLEKYFYTGDSVVFSESFVTDFKKKQFAETQFNREGLATEKKVFAFEAEKGSLLEQSSWKYDSSKRIIEHEKIDYSGSKRNSQKDVYSYTGYSDKPDYAFYEDGEIRLKRLYKANGEYTETTYFDGGFSVKTSYKHGIKMESILYLNSREQSRTEYAKE